MKQQQQQQQQHKLYVITRPGLSPSHAAVQGGHALAQYMIDHPDTPWRNWTLIYLTCSSSNPEDPDTLEGLLELLLPLREASCTISTFKEPYWDDLLTAVAVYGSGAEHLLKDYRLL